MDHLSIVAQILIVAGAAFAGPLLAFLLALLVTIFLRSTSAANEPPAIAWAMAGRIGGLLRASLGRAAGKEMRSGIVCRRPATMTRPAPTPP